MMFRRAPDTHFAKMSDETGVVLDVGARNYLHLNATGALLWGALEQGATLEALAERLVVEYGVSSDDARSDTRAWLADMLARGAIVSDG